MSNGKHLNQMVGTKSICVESVYEMKIRLRLDAAKARHQRKLESIQMLIQIFMMFGMFGASLVVGGLCLYVSLSSRFNQDAKSWARSLLQIIMGGILGFITGRSLNKPNPS